MEIKNWFQGKLDFAVAIPDLSGKGVNLVGGRLCHLRDGEVAYLIYKKEAHNISVFVIFDNFFSGYSTSLGVLNV